MVGKTAPGSLPPPPAGKQAWVGLSKNLSRSQAVDENGLSTPPHLAIDPGPYGTHQEPALGWGKLTPEIAPFLSGYTPEAQALAYNTPVLFEPGPYGGYWASAGVDSPHNNSLTSRPHLMMAQGLGGPAEATARHELGHMYDSHYGITSQTPTGLAFEDAVHPNMNPFTWDVLAQHPSGNWDRPALGTIEQWGNPQEVYAGMNQDPQAIPQAMRGYFPQFAAANYQPGPYQPKNTGRVEINEQAAPDWNAPSLIQAHAYDPRLRPPASNPTEQGAPYQQWEDYYNTIWPLTVQQQLGQRDWRAHTNSNGPPGPAPAGLRWQFNYYNDDGNFRYWDLIPMGGGSA